MRKSCLFAAVLCTAVFASCSQDEHLDFVKDGKSNFTGALEMKDSRTSLDGNKVVWSTDDQVSIFEGDNANSLYEVDGITNGVASFKFVSYTDPTTWIDLDANYAVYPYDENNTIAADGTISAVVPAAYTFKDRASSIENALMAAKSENTQLNFINAQGIIRLRLNAKKPTKYGNIQSIKLTSEKNNLTGTATISFANTSTPSAVITGSDAGKELTINLADELKTTLPASTSSTFTEFYVPVVPTDFPAGDLTLTVVGDKDTYVYKINAAISVGRKVIKPITHTLDGGGFSGEIDGETTEAWDGESVEPVTENNGIYEITKASQLAWISEQVNNKTGNYFSGKTVKLGADIDLGNQDWNPIGQTGVASFNGTFDGNNKTIKNLYIDNTDVTGEYGAAGLFGWVEHHSGDNSITNLTLDGVTIKSHRYSGAIAGWINIPVTNCTVKNVEIECTYYNEDTDGTKVGALVGYADNGSTLGNNVVEKAVINAYGDVGGLVGVAQTTVAIDGNTVKSVNVNYLSTVKSVAGEIASTRVTPILETNTTTDVVISLVVSNSEALKNAVAAGVTNIYLQDGEYNVDGCGGKTLTIGGSKNAVLKIYNEGEDGCDYGFDGSNVTFRGLTIDSSANTGNYKGYARLNANFYDCNINGAYTTSCVQSFHNCSFNTNNGYIWIWGATEVNFDACEFGYNSKAILAHGYASTVINIKDCKFNATEKGYTGDGDNTACVEIAPAGSNTYTIKFEGTNTKTEHYAGWTRIKDGSTGHTITGIE